MDVEHAKGKIMIKSIQRQTNFCCDENDMIKHSNIQTKNEWKQLKN